MRVVSVAIMLAAVHAGRHFDLTQVGDLSLEPPQTAGAQGKRRVRLKHPDYRHFNATRCPLRRPIVLLKSGRSGSTSIEEVLMTVLQYCPGYQEISHNYSLLEHGCTNASLTEQRRVWSEALDNNGIISHNPTTNAGGCFSSYYHGAQHLPTMLRESGATVVSWTRNNVLRQKYSDMAARVTGDYGGHTNYTLWEGSPKGIVGAVINGACQMLAIQRAQQLSTEHHDQVVQYEDYANDPYSTVKRLLGWASLKEGYTPDGLLAPHVALLERRPEPEMPSCATLFSDPDGVQACVKHPLLADPGFFSCAPLGRAWRHRAARQGRIWPLNVGDSTCFAPSRRPREAEGRVLGLDFLGRQLHACATASPDVPRGTVVHGGRAALQLQELRRWARERPNRGLAEDRAAQLVARTNSIGGPW